MTARDYPSRCRPTPQGHCAAWPPWAPTTGGRPAIVRTISLALALVCALALGGCASSGGPVVSPGTSVPARLHPPPADPRASNEVLIRAIGLVGTPYRYGGNTPEGGFDCSGLVGFVFMDAAGLRLPRSTAQLVSMRAPGVGTLELEPGDLLFFSPGGGTASHIGIFVGEGRFVHAPSTGGTVRLDRLDGEYWRRAFVGARRVLQAQ